MYQRLGSPIFSDKMPTYTYFCDHCNNHVELFYHISDYQENPQCLLCQSPGMHRDYSTDIGTLSSSIKKSDGELKTIGDLANRNRDRMSDEQKQELYMKHNSYKHIEPNKELPKGMSRIKKPITKPKWS